MGSLNVPPDYTCHCRIAFVANRTFFKIVKTSVRNKNAVLFYQSLFFVHGCGKYSGDILEDSRRPIGWHRPLQIGGILTWRPRKTCDRKRAICRPSVARGGTAAKIPFIVKVARVAAAILGIDYVAGFENIDVRYVWAQSCLPSRFGGCRQRSPGG